MVLRLRNTRKFRHTKNVLCSELFVQSLFFILYNENKQAVEPLQENITDGAMKKREDQEVIPKNVVRGRGSSLFNVRKSTG